MHVCAHLQTCTRVKKTERTPGCDPNRMYGLNPGDTPRLRLVRLASQPNDDIGRAQTFKRSGRWNLWNCSLPEEGIQEGSKVKGKGWSHFASSSPVHLRGYSMMVEVMGQFHLILNIKPGYAPAYWPEGQFPSNWMCRCALLLTRQFEEARLFYV